MKQLTVRMSDEEHARLQRDAARAGMKMAAYLRECAGLTQQFQPEEGEEHPQVWFARFPLPRQWGIMRWLRGRKHVVLVQIPGQLEIGAETDAA